MFLIVSQLVAFLIGAYAAISLFAGQDCPKWLAAAGSALIFAASLRPLLGAFRPGYCVDMASAALFNALVLLAALLLVKDLAAAPLIIGERFKWWSVSVRFGLVNAGICAAACAAAGLGLWEAVRVPAVVEKTMEIPGLPDRLDGLRVAHLSDLHVEERLPKAWLEEIVVATNAAKPDMVLITGDFADDLAKNMRGAMSPLSDLKAPVFGVSGNHEDYWGASGWIGLLNSLGVMMLENRSEKIEIRGKPVVVAGISDFSAREGIGKVGPDVDLLLVHQPRFAAMWRDKAKAVFAGHTHGGQFLGLGWLVARQNGGYLSGIYGNMSVSPGTGLWRGLMMRLGVPAEIDVITLKRKN